MSHTIRIIVAALSFLVASSSWAAPSMMRSVRPNIYRGAFNVAGSLSIGSDTAGNSFTRMNPSIAYFFAPHISAGGQIEMWSVAGTNNYALGPMADYYFYLRDRVSASGGAALLMFNTDPGGSFYALQPNAKLRYFITPSVAIGPSFYYNLFMSQPTYIKNSYAFEGTFSIYF